MVSLYLDPQGTTVFSSKKSESKDHGVLSGNLQLTSPNHIANTINMKPMVTPGVSPTSDSQSTERHLNEITTLRARVAELEAKLNKATVPDNN